jgi:hypothetical protein
MRTIVAIPSVASKPDPDWLIKKHLKKKLNALEIEEYYKYLYELNHRKLLVETCPAKYASRKDQAIDIGIWKGVPTEKQIENAINIM